MRRQRRDGSGSRRRDRLTPGCALGPCRGRCACEIAHVGRIEFFGGKDRGEQRDQDAAAGEASRAVRDRQPGRLRCDRQSAAGAVQVETVTLIRYPAAAARFAREVVHALAHRAGLARRQRRSRRPRVIRGRGVHASRIQRLAATAKVALPVKRSVETRAMPASVCVPAMRRGARRVRVWRPSGRRGQGSSRGLAVSGRLGSGAGCWVLRPGSSSPCR